MPNKRFNNATFSDRNLKMLAQPIVYEFQEIRGKRTRKSINKIANDASDF